MEVEENSIFIINSGTIKINRLMKKKASDAWISENLT